MALVVFDGWADVPAIDAVGFHVRTLGWGDVNDDASTWWGKGTLVEIEISDKRRLKGWAGNGTSVGN